MLIDRSPPALRGHLLGLGAAARLIGDDRAGTLGEVFGRIGIGEPAVGVPGRVIAREIGLVNPTTTESRESGAPAAAPYGSR